MTIWMLQHYATPPDTVSGTRHYNFAQKLIQYGYDTTVFASSFNHSTFREERLSEEEQYRVDNIQGVRFFWIKTPWYDSNGWRRMLNMISYAFRAYAKCNVLDQRPQIIWASNPHLFSGLAGYFLAKKYGAHFIFEVRDLWPQVFVDLGAFSPRHPLILMLKLIERFVYSRAEKIIVLMSKASDYIKGCGVDPDKITYLPHALNLEMFEGNEALLTPELKQIGLLKAQGKVIIGYLGAHGIADALDTIIDCCDLLKKSGREDIHFLMIGHGSEKQRLETLAHSLGFDNISFHGFIPKKLVPCAMKLFDVGLVSKKSSPLYKYGTSFIKTFDYMASGLPVLWSVDSMDSPVRDADCGLMISAECPQEMMDAVISFADMGAEMRREMGKRGLKYVKNYHDNNLLVERLRGVLESLEPAEGEKS